MEKQQTNKQILSSWLTQRRNFTGPLNCNGVQLWTSGTVRSRCPQGHQASDSSSLSSVVNGTGSGQTKGYHFVICPLLVVALDVHGSPGCRGTRCSSQAGGTKDSCLPPPCGLHPGLSAGRKQQAIPINLLSQAVRDTTRVLKGDLTSPGGRPP